MERDIIKDLASDVETAIDEVIFDMMFDGDLPTEANDKRNLTLVALEAVAKGLNDSQKVWESRLMEKL
jgi:hypothetical protein